MIWNTTLGIGLAMLSFILYYIQIIIFHNPHDTTFYLLQDIAFVPLQVLLVTIIVSRIINIREKKILLEKMNMLIGVYFGEIGIRIVKHCSQFEVNADELKEILTVNESWIAKNYKNAKHFSKNHNYIIQASKGDLNGMRLLLLEKRNLIVNLLSNPNLLEHSSFTESLLAILHLTEEFDLRPDLDNLPDSDYTHLSNDIKRVYSLHVLEWLSYMQLLQHQYPYLFSLAVRSNPFQKEASAIINNETYDELTSQ